MTPAPESYFAVCAPGLEPVTGAELAALGLAGRAEPGGVAFEGGDADLYRASLGLRTATRLLLRLGSFRARTFAELKRHARLLPWNRLIGPGARVRLRVTCRKSKLYHQGAVAERLLAVITERTGALPSPPDAEDDADEAQLLVVRFMRDFCTISADTSGTPLYMRGYRQALAKAPLRETLAASMLLAAEWPGDTLLIDPLCGSGTIAIEAALIARRIPPGLATVDYRPRRFRFMAWPGFNAAAFERVLEPLQTAIRPTAPAPILASDHMRGAIRAARANADRAGVGQDIEFAVRPLSSVTAPAGGGWLVTNPPYGIRVGDRGANRTLTADLAQLIRSAPDGWSFAAVVAGPAAGHALGSAAVERLRTRNGGIPVRLLVRGGGGPDSQ